MACELSGEWELSGLPDISALPDNLKQYVSLDFANPEEKPLLLQLSGYRNNTEWFYLINNPLDMKEINFTNDPHISERTEEDREYLLARIWEYIASSSEETINACKNRWGHLSITSSHLRSKFPNDERLQLIINPSQEQLESQQLEHLRNNLMYGDTPTSFLVVKAILDCIKQYGYLPREIVYCEDRKCLVEASSY